MNLLSDALAEMRITGGIPDEESIAQARTLERLLTHAYQLLSAADIPETLDQWIYWKTEALKLATFITIETQGALLTLRTDGSTQSDK